MPNVDPSPFPEKPDLAQERKRAKDLLDALRNHEDDAIARFRSHHPRFADAALETLCTKAKLSDAQWVIAREYGFASWPALKAHVEGASGQSGSGTAPHTVLIWNDDATPMQFVVDLLTHVFAKSEDEANEIMLDTHTHGVGVCAVYERLDVAEAKIAEATALAREQGHPLAVTLARAKAVRFDERHMRVELTEGRTLNVTLAWFPKLLNASADQRGRYTVSEEGRALAWNDLDLTIPVSALLLGPEGWRGPKRSLTPPWVEACMAALAGLSREDAPDAWAKAQHDLGNALFRFDVRAHGRDPALLERAVAALRAALAAYDRARAARMRQGAVRFRQYAPGARRSPARQRDDRGSRCSLPRRPRSIQRTCAGRTRRGPAPPRPRPGGTRCA